MKSFKEILHEQGRSKKEFKDPLRNKNIEIRIDRQPSSQPSSQGRAARRAAKIAVQQAATTPSAQRVADAALSAKEQQAQAKGYRSPEGNITQRGVETYATRRGSLGYGDPGKDPSKYGIDPRQAAADARERSRTASQGVGAERRAARRGIKIDIAKIEKNYPSSPSTAKQTGFGEFSRRASATTSDIKTGRANISTPEMSVKDARFFKGLEPDPVKRTSAKIDAAIHQQADDLMGKKGPQQSSGYRQQGLKDLSKAVQDVDTPSSKPQVKPQQRAPKPNVRGGGPQLPDVPKSSKPTGASRVTYGRGGTPPANTFKAFSQQASVQAAKPGSTGSTSQAVQKIDTARKLSTTSGRLSNLASKTKSIGGRLTLPVTAGIEGVYDITAPEKQASIERTAAKKGSQLYAASQGAKLGASIGGLAGPWGRIAGGLIGGGLGYAGAGSAFETIAGQTPTEKKLARQQNLDTQQMRKPSVEPGSFSTRSLQTVVKDPRTGKDTVGYLTKQSYQGQEYTGYKAADTSNAARARTSSNPFERIGRTLFPDAYTKSDEENMRKKVREIKKIQGLPESVNRRKPMKTYSQFMEQAYQQSGPSQWSQRATEKFLRGSDYLANLAGKGIGRVTDFGGSLASGIVKGATGGRVDPEKIGHEAEKWINKKGEQVRDTERRAAETLSKTKMELIPPGSMYPSTFKKGR